ncbi:GNAT family N-acetyltransferase [Streptomyces sp. SP17BM10]|uniref:GNAT family N-acetyltransferase n=1 Tax=Streptomyces sp. SP17BM10 TaxID=3002530 RepID=UPI002E799864|nr:GNAT family N-acetyltransferase [Streptomyces sp. SP17BM10]MEE1783713.1 GNAT family N-acetyltransferase [Streptomyces sp. SP17BM10]
MVRIETPRLILRRWREEDVAPMAAINGDPEVMRWIADGRPLAEADTRRFTALVEQRWDEQGFGLFALEVRETGELAGFTGLAVPHFLPEVLPAVEVGWRLARTFWGRGYATEAAREAVRFGFEDCGLDRLVSIAQIGNTASEHVMDKLGMVVERETTTPATGRRVRVHELTREQYDAR